MIDFPQVFLGISTGVLILSLIVIRDRRAQKEFAGGVYGKNQTVRLDVSEEKSRQAAKNMWGIVDACDKDLNERLREKAGMMTKKEENLIRDGFARMPELEKMLGAFSEEKVSSNTKGAYEKNANICDVVSSGKKHLAENFASTGVSCSSESKLISEKYSELIYAVKNKIPDETRHETALRIIRQHESQENLPESVAAIVAGNTD